MSGAMPVSGVVRKAVGSVFTVPGTGSCLSTGFRRHEARFLSEIPSHLYPAALGSILHPRNANTNTNSNTPSQFLVVITCTRIMRAKLALLVMKWINTVTTASKTQIIHQHIYLWHTFLHQTDQQCHHKPIIGMSCYPDVTTLVHWA